MTARCPPVDLSAGPPARLKKRADFVAASKGRRLHANGFTLQAAERATTSAATGPRIGLTVTKKTGNSVARNRIRRRLREALRAQASLAAKPTHDYVILARRDLLTADFGAMRAGLAAAFEKIHAPRPPRVARTT